MSPQLVLICPQSAKDETMEKLRHQKHGPIQVVITVSTFFFFFFFFFFWGGGGCFSFVLYQIENQACLCMPPFLSLIIPCPLYLSHNSISPLCFYLYFSFIFFSLPLFLLLYLCLSQTLSTLIVPHLLNLSISSPPALCLSVRLTI